MNIPFLDIPALNRSLGEPLWRAVNDVINSGQFILGPAVERFERLFAEYLGVPHCIGLNNGTSALHMALVASGIGPGDEVITTPLTWISTSWAISYTGARPVYVDVDPLTYTLDPDQVEGAVTPRTKAILPVHLYGQAANLTRLQRVAESRGLVLIEDAAQAHGARHGGRRIGSFGKAACFSFYPGKNLGAFGEAGAVVTADACVAQRIRSLRDHAQERRHRHIEIGYNTRMEGLQGAVLAVKLPYLDAWNHRRSEHASTYRRLLNGLPGLVLPEALRPEGHVWHLYVVRCQGMGRDQLSKLLAERGVATAIHYPTLVPFQPAYAHLDHRPGDFPVAEAVAAQCLSLPMGAELTDEQISYAARAVREVVETSTRRAAA